jgi:hypothetical protein
MADDCTRYRSASSALIHHYRDDQGHEIEVRLNDPSLGAGTVDEICTAELHLEQMDFNRYWMRVNDVVFNFTARGKITLRHEADGAQEFILPLRESCEAEGHECRE